MSTQILAFVRRRLRIQVTWGHGCHAILMINDMDPKPKGLVAVDWRTVCFVRSVPVGPCRPITRFPDRRLASSVFKIIE
jgi:hypothetical protein